MLLSSCPTLTHPTTLQVLHPPPARPLPIHLLPVSRTVMQSVAEHKSLYRGEEQKRESRNEIQRALSRLYADLLYMRHTRQASFVGRLAFLHPRFSFYRVSSVSSKRIRKRTKRCKYFRGCESSNEAVLRPRAGTLYLVSFWHSDGQTDGQQREIMIRMAITLKNRTECTNTTTARTVTRDPTMHIIKSKTRRNMLGNQFRLPVSRSSRFMQTYPRHCALDIVSFVSSTDSSLCIFFLLWRSHLLLSSSSASHFAHS